MDSIIDFFIKKKIEEMEKYKVREKNELHVRELIECPEKLVLRDRYPFLVVPTNPAFMMGDLIHIGLQEIIKEWGKENSVSVEVEKEIEKKFVVDGEEYIVKGRPDIVLPDMVIEIKSAKADISIPQIHHELQLKVYMNFLKKKGRLIYITPERCAEYDYEDGLSDQDIAGMIRDTVTGRRKPYYWECSRCPFSGFCSKKIVGGDRNVRFGGNVEEDR
jgi:CRISPR-associated exonuclease Cas4